MTLIVKSLGFFASFLFALVSLFAYGYVESLSGRGYAVAILLGGYLILRCRYYVIPLLFASSHVASIIYVVPNLQLGSFVALLLTLLFLQQREDDDATVSFRPYETQIRQLLLQKDPSMLHRVDSLLERYRGKEKQLLQQLKGKYATASSVGMMSPR